MITLLNDSSGHEKHLLQERTTTYTGDVTSYTHDELHYAN